MSKAPDKTTRDRSGALYYGQHRDASSASSARRGKPINVPSNVIPNPWGRDRMSDNLTKKNPREQTVLGLAQRAGHQLSDGPPTKKRRLLEHEDTNVSSTLTSMTTTKRGHRSHESARTPARARANGTLGEPISVEDDEEDVGEPVRPVQQRRGSSPDPLDHNIPRVPRPDGAATSRVKAGLGQSMDEEVDDIESFDDEPPRPGNQRQGTPGIHSIQEGRVKEQRRLYESIPYIDLNKPHAPIRSNMKGRDGTTTKNTLQAQSAKPGPAKAVGLPVEYWYLGVDRIGDDGDWWLLWKANESKLCVQNGSPESKVAPKYTFPTDRSFSGMQASIAGSPAVLHLKTCKWDAKCCKVKGEHFRPGSKGADGDVVFKFRENDGNSNAYINFNRSLKNEFKDKNMVSFVNTTGAKSILAAAEAAREMTIQKDKRSKLQAGTSNEGRPTSPTSKPRPRARPRTRLSGADIEEQNGLPEASRRSARQSTASSTRASTPVDPEELVLVYPLMASGAGKVNITRGDLNRLKPGEFLNDTLIEFGLKLWLNDIRERDKDLADQIHVFSSFFYKKLSVKNLEEGYKSVRKWTARIDIFQKKFIIVPINENMHWYLAIIYHPEHILSPPPPSRSPPKVTRAKKRMSAASEQATPVDVEGDTKKPTSVQPANDTDELSQTTEPASESDVLDILGRCSLESIGGSRHGSPMNQSSPLSEPPMDVDPPMDLDTPGSLEGGGPNTGISAITFYGAGPSSSKKRKTPPSPDGQDAEEVKDDAKDELQDDAEGAQGLDLSRPSTYIFIFDSLGSTHRKVPQVLNSYLKLEARDKKGVHDASSAQSKQAHVPMQPNYCDCGVYLLHFAKLFMDEPEKFSKLIWGQASKKVDQALRSKEWQGERLGTFRQELRVRIDSLGEEWKKIKEAEGVKQKEGSAELKGDGAGPDESSDVEEVVIQEDEKPLPAKKGSRARRSGGAPTNADPIQIPLRWN